jgi:outer membrane receptor protein involved in Fe transport
VNEKVTVETGAQYVLKNVDNDFAVDDFVMEEWMNLPALTNIFDYRQGVLGVYGTIGYEGSIMGIKGGLRVEDTDLNTLLRNTEQENNQNFANFFPSLHTSFKLSQRFSFQAGYSRRILRPRLWSLNPFFNITDNFNIRTGNPDLLPEFTDSYEVTAIYILPKISMNFGVYHLYTTDVVENVTTVADNVSTSIPLNIGTNRATGIEFNAKVSPTKKITVSGDFNYNFFKRDGTYEGNSFDFDASRWTSRLTGKIKLPGGTDLELAGNYESDFQTFQGQVNGFAFFDAGIRKKLSGGKFVVNLSVRDIFASRVRESIVDQPDFYLFSSRLRGRFMSLGVSYSFGKGEAMEFSGRRRH